MTNKLKIYIIISILSIVAVILSICFRLRIIAIISGLILILFLMFTGTELVTQSKGPVKQLNDTTIIIGE